jgi:hypothetical protein
MHPGPCSAYIVLVTYKVKVYLSPFFKSRLGLIAGAELVDSVLDVVRKEAEGCDCLQVSSCFYISLISFLPSFPLPFSSSLPHFSSFFSILHFPPPPLVTLSISLIFFLFSLLYSHSLPSLFLSLIFILLSLLLSPPALVLFLSPSFSSSCLSFTTPPSFSFSLPHFLLLISPSLPPASSNLSPSFSSSFLSFTPPILLSLSLFLPYSTSFSPSTLYLCSTFSSTSLHSFHLCTISLAFRLTLLRFFLSPCSLLHF